MGVIESLDHLGGKHRKEMGTEMEDGQTDGGHQETLEEQFQQDEGVDPFKGPEMGTLSHALGEVDPPYLEPAQQGVQLGAQGRQETLEEQFQQDEGVDPFKGPEMGT